MIEITETPVPDLTWIKSTYIATTETVIIEPPLVYIYHCDGTVEPYKPSI